ncbi:AI-2E family transporter [Rhizobium leguminosarum bv. viciae]|uniref:AI-2E family transporter n=1 Tax=Rhizobium leguminosarum bv. viciae TaxID=387 RepID=A0A8I2KJP0_RHILV|nr:MULTISPECIES: AI-2E family transporter [Rhizobium]MBY3154130.1 AI-2E family transporter [Rhizobium laguerreae]MBY5788851.1 AI-2E family transporter [Rhizobium leguminosarum]MBY5796841.1 AI-2E family transporter [Rhizobium leguminosarum]NKM00885.1 AI-2E family transporter [Rhizobium leguminosarum bv. viciae]NKM46921.1 AI-2E family transporter [Rhizobium leguminosarum bv. viciae]
MPQQVSGNSLKRQIFFWLAVLVFFIVFLYVFSSILLPFVAGMAIAYFLDPVADRLQRLGLSRMMATIGILVAFVIVFALALMILIPVLISQFNDFAQRLPGYISQLQQFIAQAQNSLLPDWVENQVGTIKDNLSGILSEGMGFLTGLFAQIWNSGKAIVDVISLLVVTPVVAFYILLDWDRMVAKVDQWIPRDYVSDVRQIAKEIDQAIAGFIRGQGSLCLILGIYYAVGLSLVGLNFGLLIGLFAGMISFIPYVGSMVGLVLAVGVALVQFWPDYPWIGLVLVVFFSGQFLEGNILQPKLVGSSVGLHPVWLMFALFAFGALFGFVGLLVAVPAAAAVGVLVRFALSRYLQSDLYFGGSPSGSARKTKSVPNE